MKQAYPHLFSPIEVGNLTLRNRIVSPAHGTGFAKGHVMTDQHIYYHAARARGGVAMIITEALSVHPTSNT
ncbi:MAG: mycofactocin system FadH/OYE family oxidoreductase 2, partial [Dehalococcoidia bacterium]